MSVLTTDQAVLARIRAGSPPATVRAALVLVGAEAEALEWANPFGAEFVRAWDACPRGDWLMMLSLALVAGMEESLIPEQVGRGFTDMVIAAAFDTADEVRRRIDGRALMAAALGG